MEESESWDIKISIKKCTLIAREVAAMPAPYKCAAYV
jgi:hypothetical protein